MDPDATLREIREIQDKLPRIEDEHEELRLLQRLEQLTLALDSWITGGGFLPREWAANRD